MGYTLVTSQFREDDEHVAGFIIYEMEGYWWLSVV